MSAPPDPHTVTRFLDHLAERDAEAAAFARQLLDAGAVVRSIWGPVQMDVWDLQLVRGDMIMRFGIERGFSDGVLVGRADAGERPALHPVSLVVFAWARANGIPLALADPDDIEVNLAAQGIAAVDWLGERHGDAVERVRTAWLEYQRKRDRLQGRTRGRPAESDLRALKADGVAALEAAAAPLVQSDWSAARAAEEELLSPATRHDPRRVRELLHPDFIEIGRSGRRWTRDEIVYALAQERGREPVVTEDWDVTELASDLALVTYTVVGPERRSRHSSLWTKDAGRVQLRFHQGTYVAEE